MIPVNYHHLYYFYIIAKEGSIVAASEKLRLGQPTLSSQLKMLEDRFGNKLFERRQRKMMLTEEGRMVLNYAEQIFGLGNELVDIMDKKLSARSHLTLGVLESLPKILIREAILTAYQIDPCTVTVLEGSGDSLFEELSTYRLDMVLSNFLPHFGQDKMFYSRLLGEAPIAVFATPKFKHLKKNFPRSLQNQPFIMPTLHSKLRHDLDHYFKKLNLTVDMLIETQDTSVQKLLGCEGMGLVPLPEFAGMELVGAKKMICLGRLKGLTESIWLVSSPRKISNRLINGLMESFKINSGLTALPGALSQDA